MAFPSQETIDIIATKILFDAKEAILMLRAWSNDVDTAAGKVKLLKELIKSTAAQMNGDVSKATSAVQRLSSSLGVSPQLVSKIGTEMEVTGNKGESAFRKIFTSVNTTRIALGALVSMLLFQVVQAITGVFKEAVDQARQYEETLYRIANAERQLSEQGVDIGLKQIKKGIEDIHSALPIFSKEDVAQLVGGVAVATTELGFTGDEILQLAAAIAILNINSTDTETLLETKAKVVNSLLSPQAKSVGELGLSFGKAKIEAEAFQLGILKTGQSFDDLTEKQKQYIKLQIVLQTANIENVKDIGELRKIIQQSGGDYEALNQYLASNDAKLLENSASWHDLLTTIGQVIVPFLPFFATFFDLLNSGFNFVKIAIIEVTAGLVTFGIVATAVFTGQITNIKEFVKVSKDAFDEMTTAMTNVMFPDVPANAPSWFKYWGDRIKQAKETATTGINVPETESQDTIDALGEIDKRLQDIALSAKQAGEDLKTNLGRKQADLDLEYNRKAEDAAENHAQKLSDINKDVQQKITDAKEKSREDEKKGEEDLLQKLKELRARFLFDLEDALHERDARQVLRLIREYQLNKQNILDQKRQDDQARKEKLAADIDAIETEKKRRIEAENLEYSRRLDDLNTAKAREQADLETWYKREQEDLKRHTDEQIQTLLNGYIQSGKITAEGQAQIQAMLLKYFGGDMAIVHGAVDYMNSELARIGAGVVPSISADNTALSRAAIASLTGSGSVPVVNTYKPLSRGSIAGLTGKAEGGTFITNRPALAVFGERGAEMATFTPLNRTGRDVNKVFNDIAGGTNGYLDVRFAMDLSDGLEAKIVRMSSERVGKVMSVVNKTKRGL